MTIADGRSYELAGFWARLKRASLTLGVPIALAAILPIALTIIAALPKEAWMLLAIAVMLADLRTAVRRKLDRKRKSVLYDGRMGRGFPRRKSEKTTFLEDLLILVVFFVGLPLIVAQELLRQSKR